MDLAKLQMFAQVASSGSLTKAAVQLDMSSSAISRQLSLLEKECGGRLFHRTGRGVSLSELGQRILPKVQTLLVDAAELQIEMKASAGMTAGEVRLGVLAGAITSLMPPLLTQLRARHPNIRLRVLEGSTGQMDEWIASGHVDIALAVRQAQAIAPGELPLTSSHSYLIGPANDSLTQAETVRFDQLHEVPLVLPGLPNGLRRAMLHIMKGKGLSLNVVLEADSLLLLVAIVAQRCGYTVLPRHAVHEHLVAGTLTAARLVDPDISRTVVLTTSSQRPLAQAGREVFRLVREISQQLTEQKQGVWTPVAL